MYLDRLEAGDILGQLVAAEEAPAPLVMGIARGGVMVAARIAEKLRAPLEVILARKVGLPGNPELAIGAVGEDGAAVWDEEVVQAIGVSLDYLEREAGAQRQELRRRLDLYRGGRPAADPAGHTVYLVDDGLATGMTAVAASRSLRCRAPRELVLTVPVASFEALDLLGSEVDRIICPLVPADFSSVGRFYRDFSQIGDEQVVGLLRDAE